MDDKDIARTLDPFSALCKHLADNENSYDIKPMSMTAYKLAAKIRSDPSMTEGTKSQAMAATAALCAVSHLIPQDKAGPTDCDTYATYLTAIDEWLSGLDPEDTAYPAACARILANGLWRTLCARAA